MKIKKLLLTSLISILVISCASNPNSISTAYVSPLQYSNYDCDQIGLEQIVIERRITQLYSALRKDAGFDGAQAALGVVLFPPLLLALEGGDGPVAGEYALMKGQYEALQTVSVQKKCDLTFAEDPNDVATE